MGKHTEGPWRAGKERDGVVSIHGHLWAEFAEVVVKVNGRPNAEGRANALLIAAAPDLLAALQWALSEIYTEPCEWPCEDQTDAHRAAIEVVKKAGGAA